jgi:hypothetical protein
MFLENKIYHFYHAYADGKNSLLAITLHLNNLISSNLSKHLEKLCIGIVGAEINRKKIKELLLSRANEIPIEIVVEAEKGYEQITLDKMLEFSKFNQGYYFYAHSKSAAYAHRSNICWMNTMEYHNLINWAEVVSRLNSNDAAGCFWLTHKKYPNLIHWFNVDPNTNSFFAGNYWWTTSEVIRELPLPDKSNRYMAEQWIGKKQNLKVYDLHPGLPKQKNLNCSKYGLSCHCTRKKYIKKIRYVFLYIGFLYGIYSLLEKL